ncbi:polyamine ABC transporter ATP-binding protein [Pokkaliibacter sp. MBI-7]|uniref:polyamine ABC transporter ATP-binding protein n=1 Tax=Pokkaliibacter sp. MBI-7 TaxID=3040600 RepID=UPI002447E137|nr:polyamine ABC transporter ATP-binding protein [Pokkaliibacter sp. MBI-7]MDH2432596.1 polyamine ABC transporter ATP-binding protein [Pokkaliibacter sp. MBI-7]
MNVATSTAAMADSAKRPEQTILQIQQVTKMFGDTKAVNDVSLDIRKGEIFALLGGSGCGKTTLLRMLAGFERPTAGRIILDGQDITALPPYERPINMMFQSYALFPHMSVEQNIAFGLKQDGMTRNQIGDRVAHMLKLVHMSKYARRKPHQLSGGQRQRVALARSLAKHPKLLLLDEPMGALDKKLRTQMQLEVVNIIESVGVTCVMVTHDQEEAMTMAGRLGIMDSGEICQVGSPTEVYEYPNSRLTAEFIGSVNIFEGVVDEQAEDAEELLITSSELECPLALGLNASVSAGMPVAVAVRPEKISVSFERPEQTTNWVKGTVSDIAYLGGISNYHVEIAGGHRIQCTVANVARSTQDRATWGDEVYLSWDTASGVVLIS